MSRYACVSIVVILSVAIRPTSHGQAVKQPPLVNLDKFIQIRFDKKKYTFTQAEAAKGVKFHYQIIVKKDLPGMIPAKQTSAAFASPSRLLPLPKITGNGQFYAIVDVGLAPPRPPQAITIKKGVYKRTFSWDGRNWRGPSDFGAKKGKPFPPGKYTWNVSMVGTKKTATGMKRYKISAEVPVIIK